MSDILHVARYRRPNQRWHREPCLHADCRRAAVRGRLCDECHEHVLLLTRKIIAPYDLHVRRVGVSDGYIVADTINAYRSTGVHRIVMECELERPLVGIENVHHLNGNRADNRPHNLELWVSSQPSGQRPDDLATYARELLSLYGTDAERAAYGMEATA